MVKSTLRILVICPVLASLVACESMPGNRAQQGAVIGGAAGAAGGAAVSKNNRGLGAILGGVLGAAGGYVIGSRSNTGSNHEAVMAASQKSQSNPATAADARAATSADLNGDGFVTLDEVVAVRQAGFTDDQLIEKLRATGQVFQLNNEQENYLADHGINRAVISRIEQLNQSGNSSISNNRQDVISR